MIISSLEVTTIEHRDKKEMMRSKENTETTISAAESVMIF
jgi:hypothetical protein